MSDEEPPRLLFDLACHRCARNLYGFDPREACWHCQEPIRRSIERLALAHGGRPSLAKNALGALYLFMFIRFPVPLWVRITAAVCLAVLIWYFVGRLIRSRTSWHRDVGTRRFENLLINVPVWFWFRRLQEVRRVGDATVQRALYHDFVARRFENARGGVFIIVTLAMATTIVALLLIAAMTAAVLPRAVRIGVPIGLVLLWLFLVIRVFRLEVGPMRIAVRESLLRFAMPICIQCGYDCRGLELPRPCPECGQRVARVPAESMDGESRGSATVAGDGGH